MIALAFGLLALRGVTANTPVGPDATRHVMNGAFLYDLVRNGKLSAPLEFGVYYYSRLPSLSLPYHPPLFPAFEALSFIGFGVQALTPRVLVALATASSAYLYYRLVVRTYGSAALAAASTIGFFMLRGSQYLARDVMLEFPMLVFVLGAMHCVVGLDRTSPLRRGLAFGFLAGAAMWTKQSAVFIGLVPFLYGGISAQWSLLRARALWVSTALLAMAAVGLLLVSSPPGRIAPPQVVGLDGFVSSLGLSLTFYSRWIWSDLGPLAIVAVAVFLLGLVSVRGKSGAVRPGDALYIAWGLAAVVPLLLAENHAGRYLFVLYPCLVVLACAGLLRLGRWILPRPWASVALVVLVVAWAVVQLATAKPLEAHVEGPAEAARQIVAAGSRRVLYCGGKTNGHFIFEVRQLDPNLRTIVIRCDKLPPELFYSQARLERFAHRYGIDHVVLEQSTNSSPWDGLETELMPPLFLEGDIAMAVPGTRGRLRVYRFAHPSPNPVNTLVVPLGKRGPEPMEFTLRF